MKKNSIFFLFIIIIILVFAFSLIFNINIRNNNINTIENEHNNNFELFWNLQFDNIENNQNNFYLRIISNTFMAQVDLFSKIYGEDLFFYGLQKDNIYTQFISINKLVEYFNDEQIRKRAIQEITPFLNNPIEQLRQAAEFSLSILNENFDNTNIIKLSDTHFIFTLFNNYSDYGSYNKIYEIDNKKFSEIINFNFPNMYIKNIILSPDNNKIVINTCSNKSEYLIIFDFKNNIFSPELVDSFRIKIANENNFIFWQRSDFENYSIINNIKWLDNNIINFEADLGFDGEDKIYKINALYNFDKKIMILN